MEKLSKLHSVDRQ